MAYRIFASAGIELDFTYDQSVTTWTVTGALYSGGAKIGDATVSTTALATTRRVAVPKTLIAQCAGKVATLEVIATNPGNTGVPVVERVEFLVSPSLP